MTTVANWTINNSIQQPLAGILQDPENEIAVSTCIWLAYLKLYHQLKDLNDQGHGLSSAELFQRLCDFCGGSDAPMPVQTYLTQNSYSQSARDNWIRKFRRTWAICFERTPIRNIADDALIRAKVVDVISEPAFGFQSAPILSF